MKLNLQTKRAFTAYPVRVICISFAFVILVGTLLLTLPISSRNGLFTPIDNAFFTATSATCVTGLVVYDTFAHWSTFGQVIILLLIQIGGLGLVTFTSFFNVLIRKRIGLRSMQLAQESINSTSIIDIQLIVKRVVIASFIIEFAGALVLSGVFIPKYGLDGIFISIFLAISAFCNAGFDILGREGPYVSLCHYNSNAVVMITIALLIIIGGLGFTVWHDLYDFRRTKKLQLHTKVVLGATVGLIIIGMVAFLALEWKNPMTLYGMSTKDKFLAGFFQSVSTRTAGFNSVNLNNLNDLTKLVFIFLMFIGAAPGSTGGGVKVTTVAVLIMTVISVVRGRQSTMVLGKRVPKQTVYKALSVVFLGAVTVCIAAGATYFITGPKVIHDGIDALFEACSAFATVGLSVGVTSRITLIPKLILSLTMFIGRVGPVSLMFALAMSNNSRTRKQVAPEGKIMVG